MNGARIEPEERGLLRIEPGSMDSELRREANRLLALHNDPFNWRAADRRPLAVYIGPAKVGVELARMQTDWRFTHCDSIEGLYAQLEDGSIDSSEPSAILIVDKYYSPSKSGEPFERLAATMAPYCFFGILSYEPELQEPIRTAISNAAEEMAVEQGEVYFIDAQKPLSSLGEAIDSFLLSKPETAAAAVRAIGNAR